jgi:hypothetical protein
MTTPKLGHQLYNVSYLAIKMMTFMDILSNKLQTRNKNKQFVNNEFVNNTPLIINHNAVPSRSDATVVPDRILMLMRNTSSDINNKNNNHSTVTSKFTKHFSPKCT